MKNDYKEACHCKNVTYGKIRAAIAQGARTPEEIQRITGYGTGCGKCRELMAFLIRDFLEEQEAASGHSPASP